MSVHYCPFCHQPLTLNATTVRQQNIWIDIRGENYSQFLTLMNYSPAKLIIITIIECPECHRYEILAQPTKTYPQDESYSFATHIYPAFSTGNYIPEYIPQVIRDDYHEAYSILELSPKAAATLARRCMQGIIRNVFNISEHTLAKEIDDIKDKIDPSINAAMNDLRQLGNIGAHMETDVNNIIDIDEGEAHALLQFVEVLIREWYINPHERKELLTKISSTNTEKQNLRKSNP